jgi:hypothetical protein
MQRRRACARPKDAVRATVGAAGAPGIPDGASGSDSEPGVVNLAVVPHGPRAAYDARRPRPGDEPGLARPDLTSLTRGGIGTDPRPRLGVHSAALTLRGDGRSQSRP